MLRSRRLVPTFIVIMLTATPLAIAGWSAKGNYEPDTLRDQTDHLMELDPAAGNNGNHVYFNGFIGQGGGQVSSDISPNVGTIQSGNGASHWTMYTMLGVWRDCNGDKFIGFADQGLFEYRSELLVTAANVAQCPVDPPTAPIIHNDGKWVHEFVPIMWKPQSGDVNTYDINDNSSRTWYDFGLPEDGPASTCWLNPHPRGTYHSVGGLLFTYDCIAGYRVTDTYDGIADAAAPAYSFSDHPRDQYNSASQANVKNPWGEESDAGVVQAWDCSQPPLVQQTIPEIKVPGVATVNTAYVNVSAPNGNAPNTVNPSGSAAGTVNRTASGTDRCTPRTDRSGNGNTGTAARAPYALEGDVGQSAAKRAPQGNLVPVSAARGSGYCPQTTNATDPNTCEVRVGGTGTPADGQGVSYHPSDVYGPILGDGTPRDLGVRQGVSTYSADVDGFWSENVLWTGFWPASINGGLAGARYTTYYAFVSPGAVSAYNLILPGGSATHAYGAENCGSHTSGIYNGWDCDANNWYKDASGNDIRPRSAVLGRDQSQPPATLCTASGTGATSRGCISYAAFPGSPYNLRDIDCWDDSNSILRPLGVSEETVANAVTSITNPTHVAQLCQYPTP